ncbi:MAG: class I adenylate-forming enzyme family protein [Anaerovoracaceae bacterium]|jgi:acyl-CoA synthetase (AMP-forming)/AMP-acid ligase II
MRSILEALATHATDPATAEKLCLADSRVSVTYREMWNHIWAVSARLQRHGLQSGDCVVVQCTQDVNYMICAFAIQLAGGIFVPTERNASIGRVKEIVDSTEAKIFMGNKAFEIEAEFLNVDSIQEMDDVAPDDLSQIRFPEREDTSEILFSTGTTGKSKGIELSFANDIAIAENVTLGVQMKKDNVELIPMPLSHSHGLRRTYSNMYNGSSVIILNGVTFIKPVYDMIEKYKVTSMDMAPSILTMLFKLSRDKLSEYKDQMDYIQIGSAPLMQEDKDHLSRLLPKTSLYDFYGTTEAGCSCIIDFNKITHRPGCIGRPAANAKFIFVDEDRNPKKATAEDPGLMAIGGGQNMIGYFKEPELTASVVADGFIYTSDLGYTDEDGLIYYLGRQDDVINCGGIKISPDEIEKEVSKYPAVHDCCCVPIPDKVQGQMPKLFISLEPEADYDARDFRKYLRTHLDGNKQPKEIEVIDEIPRTFNGKVQRKKLMKD